MKVHGWLVVLPAPQDPRKDCQPVDCVEKYNGWRNFFRNSTGKCEVIHECYTKGKKGELPEIVSMSDRQSRFVLHVYVVSMSGISWFEAREDEVFEDRIFFVRFPHILSTRAAVCICRRTTTTGLLMWRWAGKWGWPALPGFLVMLCYLYIGKHNLCSRTMRAIQASNHTYQLSQTDFVLPRFNTFIHDKHLLRYHGPKLWSNPSSNERLASNLKAFKSQIKRRDLSSFLQDRCKAAFMQFLVFITDIVIFFYFFYIDFT